MTRTIRHSLTVAALLALGACAGTNYSVALSQACTVYATALTDLAVLRAQNRLSADQVAKVEAVRSVATPLCTSPQSDPRSALAAVEKAMLNMPKGN